MQVKNERHIFTTARSIVVVILVLVAPEFSLGTLLHHFDLTKFARFWLKFPVLFAPPPWFHLGGKKWPSRRFVEMMSFSEASTVEFALVASRLRLGPGKIKAKSWRF